MSEKNKIITIEEYIRKHKIPKFIGVALEEKMKKIPGNKYEESKLDDLYCRFTGVERKTGKPKIRKKTTETQSHREEKKTPRYDSSSNSNHSGQAPSQSQKKEPKENKNKEK